jgi:ABC-type xylose transport system substrate-binding protein
MKYTKPELVLAGSAFEVVRNIVKDTEPSPDSHTTFTEAAYEADE